MTKYGLSSPDVGRCGQSFLAIPSLEITFQTPVFKGVALNSFQKELRTISKPYSRQSHIYLLRTWRGKFSEELLEIFTINTF